MAFLKRARVPQGLAGSLRLEQSRDAKSHLRRFQAASRIGQRRYGVGLSKNLLSNMLFAYKVNKA